MDWPSLRVYLCMFAQMQECYTISIELVLELPKHLGEFVS